MKVELLNHTEDGDLLVVNAARCSFDKEHKEFDIEKDTRLINYLAREKHVLPFRHPNATLRISCPIFVHRQLGKHQVGFSWSEVSRRYITSEPSFFEPFEYRKSAKNVKQGSSLETHENNDLHRKNMQSHIISSLALYNTMLEDGVCPEQARMVLPQNMETTSVVTGSLLGWHHLYKLRSEEHTQKETREYAQMIGSILSECFPVSWAALRYHESV
jgi:thymidylate synthase (FAD)